MDSSGGMCSSQIPVNGGTQLAELLSSDRPIIALGSSRRSPTNPSSVSRSAKQLLRPTDLPDAERVALMQYYLQENLQLAKKIMDIRERLAMRPEMIAKLIEFEHEKNHTPAPSKSFFGAPCNSGINDPFPIPCDVVSSSTNRDINYNHDDSWMTDSSGTLSLSDFLTFPSNFDNGTPISLL